MKNFKILFTKMLSIICICTLYMSYASTYDVYAKDAPPELNSEGVVLMDGSTGEILYSKNGDKQFFPASTTKVLTALIALENCNLNEKVTVGKNPPFADGSSIGLREGEILTVKELILGLLLESGNDCAETLAEHISGSKEEFAKLMNKRAKELGATNSNVKNPSGLPDKEHLTTPKDLALIMKEATNNKDFVSISKTVSLKLPPSNLDGAERYINNHNYVLLPNSKYYYPYSVAAKKGYTVAAKFTNVMSAEKDGLKLVASFLRGENINDVYSDVHKIFDYGFKNFTRTKLYSEGDEIGSITLSDGLTVPLLISKDIYYTTDIDSKNSLQPTLKYDNPIDLDTKSFNRGDTIATAKVFVNGNEITTVDLSSGITHDYDIKSAIKHSISNNKFRINLLIIIPIVLLLFLRIRYLNAKRKRYKRYKKNLKNLEKLKRYQSNQIGQKTHKIPKYQRTRKNKRKQRR